MLAGYLGTLVAGHFTMFGSLSLFAVATMTGAEYAEGAVIGGLLVTLFPEILRRLDLPQDIGNVLFAVCAVQALSSGETASQALRRLLAKLWRGRAREIAALQRESLALRRNHGQAAALPVRALTVRYGAVVALDNVGFDIRARTVVGLIGPNGAGKSSFIDAVRASCRVTKAAFRCADGRSKGKRRTPGRVRACAAPGRPTATPPISLWPPI